MFLFDLSHRTRKVSPAVRLVRCLLAPPGPVHVLACWGRSAPEAASGACGLCR